MDKDEKGFEAKVEGMYSSGGCACQVGMLERKETFSKKWYAKTVVEYSKPIKKPITILNAGNS